ncbi:hypothetical protein Q9295_00250 [Xinfangfangia sp. CPCC 101601]|uniref:Uncharacterized protein n=1 Tax=Pseudogemmobacter lacusdianii TaxID=3069608 RepID=A0ABU0VST5_9RHOB|nr:hypothetical protein [Xinfangfangia sp. CPCC 101601]MDQ2064790.1 hypothetical protein [Xinfangfangia sp. CPCC 101601]
MTALKKYSRLESTGLWREGSDGQRREVIVRMGEATLMLADPRSEQVLSHWSLPAVTRLNPGQRPALYAPGEDAEEELEIADDDMIGALKTVQSAVRAATPRPGRLRGALTGGITLAIVLFAVTVLPGVLTRHTASVVPAAKRAEIGQRALDDITRLTGQPCTGETGLPALFRLSERIFGLEDTPILYVLPEGLQQPAHLPGGVILLPRALAEAGEDAQALAGAALTEGVASHTVDPMLDILDHAGLISTFRLLTTGELPANALQGYGEDFLRHSYQLPPTTSLVAAFEAAQIPMTPFGRALEGMAQPQAAQVVVEADPYKGLMPSPLLSDTDWVALQSVCEG